MKFIYTVIVSSLIFSNVAVAAPSSCLSFYNINSSFVGIIVKSKSSKGTSQIIESLQAVKPGDLVSYTVRNPYGHDPDYLRPEVGIFEGFWKENGKNDTVVISGRLNHIRLGLVGGIKILKSAGQDK